MRIIDAEALVEDIDKKIDEEIKSPLSDNHKFFFCAGMRYVVRLVKRLPTVDTVKHGHWIHSSSTAYLTVSCSECGYKVNHFLSTWQTAKYCPNCGAKMDGESNGV